MKKHPAIDQIACTSFPKLRETKSLFVEDLLQQVEDHPVEDFAGDEIRSNDIYYVMKDGTIVLEQNLSEYAVKKLGAQEFRAK